MESKEKEKKIQATELLEKISKINIFFEKEADEKNQLYGSISKKEILEFFNTHNVKIKSDDLIIKEQIKSIGEHKIEINPYIDVTKEFNLTVKKN